MNTTPRSPGEDYPHKTDDIAFERAANARTIGRPEVSREFGFNGMTGYLWTSSEHDLKLLDVANWGQFRVNTDSDLDESEMLELPFGVRSGASVLSGMEAWKGEKKEIIEWVINYQEQVLETVGGVDVGMTFDTIGTPKDKRELFTVPPHDITYSKHDAGLWFSLLRNDLEGILKSEPTSTALVDGFDHLDVLIRESEELE